MKQNKQANKKLTEAAPMPVARKSRWKGLEVAGHMAPIVRKQPTRNDYTQLPSPFFTTQVLGNGTTLFQCGSLNLSN